MKFAYKFSNLFGTIYRKGNLCFTHDGNSVISPVGNRITIYDLKNNKSKTLSLESKFNYTTVAISPNDCIMIAINEQGEAQMISLISHTVIHTHKFSQGASCIQFSPDGKYFAVGKANIVSVFIVPGEITGEYGGFKALRHFVGSYDDITWIDWSTDSKLLAVGSKDNTTKICALDYYDNFRPYILSGHTDSVVGSFFMHESLDASTISRNGQLCIWECSLKLSELEKGEPKVKVEKANGTNGNEENEFDLKNIVEKTAEELEKEEQIALHDDDVDSMALVGRDEQGKLISDAHAKRHPFFYTRLARHYLADEVRKENRNATLTAANYHKRTKLLITAFSTGAFYLHELPDVNMIHSLNISDFAIQAACFNITGDWIALGSSNLGQLLVWEWQSEQYVMKQQGHSNEMNCVAYSPDGQYIVTGGDDAKVKVWNVNNGFCFITFSEHTSAVTAIEFSANKKFLVSASLDGTVRAYDLIRYRNFRTLTTPRPVQFASLALDHSGELVVAGGQDVFEIYLWSIKLGRLLEVLSGHEGPVSALAFAPVATSTTLVSGSWDKTIKIWNCIETSGEHETIEIMGDVTAVAFKPNGEEVAVAALNGNIQVFNVRDANQVASIEGRNDLGSGVSEVDLITAKKNLESKCFTTIAYSADGETLLAAGKSKNVCIYHVTEGILLKKFEITQNHSLDGLDEFINHRKLTDFGNLALIEKRDPLEGGNVAIRLPGVQKGDMASRNFKPEIKVFSVRFSPSAQSWAAATTEGLLIYSLDQGIVFDPINLSLEVTPKAARDCLKNFEYSSALIMALKLNESNLILEIIEQIPYTNIKLVVASLPDIYAERALDFIGKQITVSQHIEFYLHWSTNLLTMYANKDNVFKQQALVAIQDSLTRKYEALNKICDYNKYTLKVLIDIADTKQATNNGQLLGNNKTENGHSDTDSDDDVGNLILIRKKSEPDDDENPNEGSGSSSDEN